MDYKQLFSIVSKIRNLSMFLGSFPADLVPSNIDKTSFCINNSDPSTEPGTHWVIADRDGVLYFGDSLRRPLDYYEKTTDRFEPNTETLVHYSAKSGLAHFCAIRSLTKIHWRIVKHVFHWFSMDSAVACFGFH